jgi:predicted nucleotide-binding protein
MTEQGTEKGASVTSTDNPAGAQAARVFVIHGRDQEAVDVLSRFLAGLGLEHVQFEEVADRIGANPFIADIVVRGISEANIVIGLFTPDEVAALYDTSGKYVAGSARWQARPNVLFEAGVAWGVAREKVVLATLGADVELFSDVNGIHILRLDQEKGRRSMATRIENILGQKFNVSAGYLDTDFSRATRKRWDYYDEMNAMERELRDKAVGTGRLTAFDVLKRAVRELGEEKTARVTLSALMDLILRKYEQKVTNEIYWWSLVVGIFRFKDINTWFDDNGVNWKHSVDYCEISQRGRAFLNRIAG